MSSVVDPALSLIDNKRISSSVGNFSSKTAVPGPPTGQPSPFPLPTIFSNPPLDVDCPALPCLLQPLLPDSFGSSRRHGCRLTTPRSEVRPRVSPHALGDPQAAGMVVHPLTGIGLTLDPSCFNLHNTLSVYTQYLRGGEVVWMGFARPAEQPPFNTCLPPEGAAPLSLQWH